MVAIKGGKGVRNIVRVACAAMALHAVSSEGRAQAPKEDMQVRAEALGQCMVMKSTGADRLLVARWFVSSLASAP